MFNTAKYPPSRGLKTGDFRWQVANAQPAGTSETSQVATDHINNPNVINNIAYVNYRPKHRERTADGVEREVYHVLKDGADSIGSACLDDPTPRPGVNDTACAALRVYVNIGVCASFWTTLHDPVYGLKRTQGVFDPKKARQESSACNEGWTATEARMGVLEAFLQNLAAAAPCRCRWRRRLSSQGCRLWSRGERSCSRKTAPAATPASARRRTTPATRPTGIGRR